MKNRLFFTLSPSAVSLNCLHVVRVALSVAVPRASCLFNAAYICLLTFSVACEALFFLISAFFSIVKLVSFGCLYFLRFLCGSLVRWFTCGSFGFCAYVFVGCFHRRSELLNSSRLSVYNLYAVLPHHLRHKLVGHVALVLAGPYFPIFRQISYFPMYRCMDSPCCRKRL